MVATKYWIPSSVCIRIALAADLHNRKSPKLLQKIRAASPDIIAVAGDLMEGRKDGATVPEEQGNALDFLSEAAAIAPTFYALGNNERIAGRLEDAYEWNIVRDTGAILLDNCFTKWNDIWIGGLSSAYSKFVDCRNAPEFWVPNTDWIASFDALPGFKILLCHHVEYYPRYLSGTSIPLILSGHAHGGQWQIFGRGIYAPGQGLFPKLTGGVHDGRLVISRGLANTRRLPRVNNPTELVIVDAGNPHSR